MCISPLFAQNYGTGAILDPDRYEQTDAKPALVYRNYASLPAAVSLKQYSPVPENQGEYGTCTGWATAFAARTISESIALNRTNQELISNDVFSPLFVYKSHYMIHGINPTGHEGAYIPYILDFIKNEGTVKRQGFERTTDFPLVSISDYAGSRRYPIADYVRLFSNPRGTPGKTSERILPVKKSLSEGKPVIIGMNTPPSFFRRGVDVWRPVENPGTIYGGHAMCVIGYDDNQYGGAFEIQNSWGTEWGNKGYIWMRYIDFAAFVLEAYEIIENLAMYNEAVYAASIAIEIYNNPEGMPVTFDEKGYYKTQSSFPSGTEFRFLMTNRYPAYVYAFAADTGNSEPERIFPLQGVSPVLDYSESTVAWPGENDWIRLDDAEGTDYLAVLFSKEALNIEEIEKNYNGGNGDFAERVALAVGENFISYEAVKYNPDIMEFYAESQNPKAVFGLLLAISHHPR